MSGSLPRPGILVLLGVALIASVFMLTRKGGDEAAAPPPPAAGTQTGAAPATPGSAAQTTPPASPGAPATTPQSVPRTGVAAKQPRVSQSRTLPAPVSRALRKNKTVVLLFWSPVGVDDRAVENAVDALPRHGGKVAVFKDRLKRLARYTRITAGANIAQTPTLVVANRKGEARVATGYLDPATVEQYVVDALRGAP
jgi:hypothetical protein